jgi:hypothetical protein
MRELNINEIQNVAGGVDFASAVLVLTAAIVVIAPVLAFSFAFSYESVVYSNKAPTF